MSERISDRHENDLGGRFLPFGDTNCVEVTIVIPPAAAREASAQHTAWMLINLLCRQQGVVQQIGLECPDGIPLAGRVVPLAARDLDLRGALIAGCRAIDIVPVQPNSIGGRVLVIGTTSGVEGNLYVLGNGWSGGFTTERIAWSATASSLPFGPYFAACLAAGEVFKAARMVGGSYKSPASAFYSGLANDVSAVPPPDLELSAIEFNFTLAGAGAVGCGLLHALWACEEVSGTIQVVDKDPNGVEATNLNRYTLFGKDSVGRAKASEAARIVADANWRCVPFDVAIEAVSPFPNSVVSAVDRNQSRAAIQNRYPGRLLSGSTRELRAEVLRCGPPGAGACLRCYNPPTIERSDEQVRAELNKLSEEDLLALASAAGTTPGDARAWIEHGGCAVAGERVLSVIRVSENDPPAFSVGFVSAMAGTMLACSIVKEELGVGTHTHTNRSVFQFWSPLSSVNKASTLLRDPACPMCIPDSQAIKVWSRRCTA